jgi:O-antigen/teichoic acid export membrane protein
MLMAPHEKNLKHVAAGAGIGLFGSLAGAMLQLLTGIIVVRLVPPAEYGVYTLAIVLVATLATLSNLGFGNGTPQLISKYLATNEHSRVRGIVLATLGIVAGVSGVLTLSLFGLSGQLARLFGKPDLAAVLQPLSFILWFNALSIALVSVCRGFSLTWPKVLFDEILNRVLRLCGLLLVAFAGWGLIGIVGVTIATTMITFGAFCFYAWKIIPRLIHPGRSVWGGRELVVFSFPLFGNNVIEILMVSASTLLLGYFKSADQVGFYNVAVTLARLLEMPLAALAFIYLPIATAAHKGQSIQEVEKLYQSSTKWIMLISLPVLLVILLDAEFIVVLLFGQAYHSAAEALRILSLGYFVHAALGPNGMTLLAFGARRAIFLTTGLAALISVVLGVALIPKWGATGAAIGVALALSISNVFISVNMYLRAGIHPLNSSYLKPLAFSLIATAGLAVLLAVHPVSAYWEHILLIISVGLICLVAPVVTRSMDVSDVAMIGAIEKRLFRKTYISEQLGKWCGFGLAKN